MSGESLNYYYLGHVVLRVADQAARAARRTRATCSRGALLLALTATAVYAFAGTLWAAAREALGDRAPRGGPVFAGLVGRGAGRRSSATSPACGRGSRPPTRRKDYAWFDPSRVIPDTINEFPSFSFLLGDLHAHVLALPFTVLALAFALQIALRGPARRRRSGARCAEALAAGAGGRRAVRDQLVVVSGRARACWRRR